MVVSDPEGSFDASSRLTPASDILLLAAGSGKCHNQTSVAHAGFMTSPDIAHGRINVASLTGNKPSHIKIRIT